MDVVTFYKSVLPGIGLRALATFKGGLKNPPTHTFYDTVEDLIAAAQAFDGLGKNVYHGCASFQTDRNRKGENAEAVKALWVDADVGPTKPYATAKDAAADILRFATTVGLASPHLVKSGGGIHAYFAFTKPIAPDQWQRLAAIFATCLDHFGVKHDSSRTEDVASILRVPGTNNYKTQPPKQVKLLAEGAEEPAAAIYRKLKAYADANGVLVFEKAKGKTKGTNDLIGTQEYPPSLAENIAPQCGVLGEVESTGGDVSYEVWWRAIGVAKHTTDPSGVAASWTRDRAAGHDKHDWQKVLDEWSAGPTTCAEFAKHCSHCGGCEFNGKITSPIQLGVDAQPVIEPVLSTSAVAEGDKEWGFAADWVVEEIGRRTRTGYSKGRMTMSVMGDDGSYKHVPFCDRYWQVMRRVRTLDGVWQLEIGYQGYSGQPFKTFLLESAAVTSPDMLRKAFSARELHIYGGTKAMSKAQEIIMAEQDFLFGSGVETAVLPCMGWATHDNVPRGDMTGEFVIGDTLVQPGSAPKKIMLEPSVDATLRSAFQTAGTTAKWVESIDFLYNRIGAEPYQFILCAMFAAPLVRLVHDAVWHGIPLALAGDTGAAKTTTAQIAMTIYARPDGLTFNANMGKNGQGDTQNAFTMKMGMLQNLPFIGDEMTSVDPEKLGGIMYTIAQGRDKDSLKADRSMNLSRWRWDTLSIITGNEDFHEKLRLLSNQHTQEATQIRSFQISLSSEQLRTVFPDVDQSHIDTLIKQNYGCVGREWLQFLVDKRAFVSDQLTKRRQAYKIDKDDQTSIRFYKDLLVNVEIAATLAKALGFIHWDIKAMMRWAKNQVVGLRDGVAERNWDGTISDFVASLHGRTIVTRTMKLGPGRRMVREMPIEPLSTSISPVARMALDDKLFFVTANALRDWCKLQNVMPSGLINEMQARGYIELRSGKLEPRMINIGGGTTVTRPQSPCWELNFQKVADSVAADIDSDAPNNVVQMTPQSVTPLVTTPAADLPDTAASP